MRLRLARLLCVTDARTDGDLAGFAAGVLEAGVDLIQLRDDRSSDPAKLAALAVLRKAASAGQALVSVYADCELAREFGADVLHLPRGGVEAKKARRCVSRWARIGRSCYSTDDIDAALADDDVHYLSVGPVFGTLPWAGRLPGLDLVRHAARVAPQATPGAKPWFAIGGITGANLDEVLDAGARRIAVGRAITAAADPASAARMFDHRLRASWRDEFDDYTLDALRD